MKKIAHLLLVSILTVSLAACANTSTPNDGGEGKGSGKVVVYSPHGEEILDAISEWFYEDTGIEVEYLFMGGGELVDRIRAEKNNPQADVIYGNPSNVFEEMKQEDLLQKYDLKIKDELGSEFVDKDGYFYGTIQTPVMLFYNENLLDEADAPKDWGDLADSKYANSLMFRSTTSAASRATFSAMIEQYYKNDNLEGAWDFLRAVDANTKSYYPDSNLMFQGIAKGEAKVGFWTLDGITKNINDNGMPLKMVAPTSGAVVISDGIAVINNCPNKTNAERFMEFAASADVQTKLANEFNRMPTNKNSLADSPQWMSEFEFETMDTNWATLTEYQSEWMQYFNDEIVSENKLS